MDLSCILLKFYIKPQQTDQAFKRMYRCILLKFYIKPQRRLLMSSASLSCILLKFYIKPQLSRRWHWASRCCILLKFYIKPQLLRGRTLSSAVVSYWNSTSNHNPAASVHFRNMLYLIEILHQTTTPGLHGRPVAGCILLKFYIKPQQDNFHLYRAKCCILLKFYIKPQLNGVLHDHLRVVSYWNSTSNHNCENLQRNWFKVVSYWNSTSNHNSWTSPILLIVVVSYWNSTSNHNSGAVGGLFGMLYLIEILHQTTTINHGKK